MYKKQGEDTFARYCILTHFDSKLCHPSFDGSNQTKWTGGTMLMSAFIRILYFHIFVMEHICHCHSKTYFASKRPCQSHDALWEWDNYYGLVCDIMGCWQVFSTWMFPSSRWVIQEDGNFVWVNQNLSQCHLEHPESWLAPLVTHLAAKRWVLDSIPAYGWFSDCYVG